MLPIPAGLEMSEFAHRIMENKYAHVKASGHKESWSEIATRVTESVVRPFLPNLVPRIKRLITERKLIPGGRYLYSAGRRYQQISNCMLFKAHDSREGWAELMSDCTNALMTGAGVGCVYSDLRGKGNHINGLGGKSSGPCALMKMVNEAGRYVMQGGSRRTAIWAGLHWSHPDVFEFVGMKNWSEAIHQLRKEDFNFPAPMNGTNISVILDDEFFDAYEDGTHPKHDLAHSVYWTVIPSMLKTGEPGFSVDVGENSGECARNACTEITSKDNRDICNLGSINLARISDKEELREVVELGTVFLLCGTLMGELPIPEMYKVREKNRRLGLGLMGVHEWLLRRDYTYNYNQELKEWLDVYKTSSIYANATADQFGISRPVATRSIAPTGTISIVAETTSGIEPLFAAAYKRRYLDGTTWKAQYVIDKGAKRLIEQGVDPEQIEDAMTLAEDYERRIQFQSWCQSMVDHGISSTINLPTWGSSINNESTVQAFGEKLFKYLPSLRGITTYPNGARGGQPLNRVPYTEAIKHIGTELVEEKETGDESCFGGTCSS
jgi:ribonucleoside-diphosphate reductase alpha chain